MKHLLKDANGFGNNTPFIDLSSNTVTFKSGVWDRIKDNMVLWYDLKRQGATNESMATNPKLIDLSGNGHDATCYNFAWSGESGIGKYTQPKFNPSSGDYLVTPSYKFTVIPSEYGGAWVVLFPENYGYDKTKSWKIKVSCLDSPIQNEDNIYIFTQVNDETIHLSSNIIDGEITTINPTDITLGHIFLFTQSKYNYAITVEMIPEYPNALVADGVDDYARVDVMPIIEDFTIIAKRKLFSVVNYTIASMSNDGLTGAFHFESDINKNNYPNTFLVSFGGTNLKPLNEEDFSWMTTNSYNGQPIIKGTDNSVHYLMILARGYQELSRFTNGALYSLLLFNKTLTTKEINWVKENLIEGDTEL